jgi:hypothetical protein
MWIVMSAPVFHSALGINYRVMDDATDIEPVMAEG